MPIHTAKAERKKNIYCKTTGKHSHFLQGNQYMGPSRLARHSGQNSSPDNDMRFTAKSRKTVNDRGTSCPTVKRQLLHLSSVYQGSSGYYREALRPVIRKIINQLETTA
jgi:hypothetical protein